MIEKDRSDYSIQSELPPKRNLTEFESCGESCIYSVMRSIM